MRRETAIAPQRPFFRLLGECLRFPWRLLFALAATAGLSASGLSLTWLVKKWVEGPLVAGDRASAAGLVTEAALLTLAMVVSLFLSRYLLASVSQRLLERLREKCMARVFELELSTARRFPTGDLLSRIFNDVAAVGDFVENGIKRLIGDGVLAAGSLAMMFLLQWKLALSACLIVPALGLAGIVISRSIRAWGARAQRAIGELAATSNEQLQGLTTIKGYQAEEFERRRFADRNASYRKKILRTEWWASFLVGTVFLVTGLSLVGAVAYLSRLVIAQRLSAGDLLAFCLFGAIAVEPFRRLSQVQGLLQRSLAAAERVYEVIDLPGETVRAGVRSNVREACDVDFDDVVFGYEGGRLVLDRLTIRIPAGESLAVVAASGGGKTTLARLLQRFYDPSAGRIRLSGRDLLDFQLAELRRLVCVVEQEPFLFSGPLKDNLRYGFWDAPRSAIEEAIFATGLEPLVRGLPGGLEATLEESGHNLSGGQRQRIALARAVVRDPAVLVLDEATSALDSEAEGRIFSSLAPWLARRTVIVLAHRLSTVRRAPRVALLHEGRVAAEGSEAELEESFPLFARLFADQLGSPSRPRSPERGKEESAEIAVETLAALGAPSSTAPGADD